MDPDKRRNFYRARAQSKGIYEIRRWRAFSLPKALGLAAMLAMMILISAALRESLGKGGLIIGAAIAELADTHAAAVSVASLVASGKMPPSDAVMPILVALSTNAISKIAVASTSGSRAFAILVVPGLILLIIGAWTAALAGGSIGP
jgi:uncharacterized membrane protein (DUF4010 family)